MLGLTGYRHAGLFFCFKTKVVGWITACHYFSAETQLLQAPSQGPASIPNRTRWEWSSLSTGSSLSTSFCRLVPVIMNASSFFQGTGCFLRVENIFQLEIQILIRIQCDRKYIYIKNEKALYLPMWHNHQDILPSVHLWTASGSMLVTWVPRLPGRAPVVERQR